MTIPMQDNLSKERIIDHDANNIIEVIMNNRFSARHGKIKLEIWYTLYHLRTH